MTQLSTLLEQAAEQPDLGNTTCLNSDHFHTIRAPSSKQFRVRLDDALFGSGDLTEAHRANLTAGLEVIEPVQRGTRGGCWSLCNISHNGETFPAGEQTYNSMAEALQAAVEWWQTETWCRGILVRQVDLKQMLANEADSAQPEMMPAPTALTATLTNTTAEAAE